MIVPSYDKVYRLRSAAQLASSLGCPLLVMSAFGAEARVRAAVQTADRSPQAWIVAVPRAGSLRGLHLASSEHPDTSPRKYRDVATKRNLGLAVALMVGWTRVLLLDDDIHGLTDGAVRSASAVLAGDGHLRVASWRSTDFPDNSAVCHAARLAGFEQDVFVGSGAMLVEVHAEVPLFPPVYNEDWLFLFDQLAERRVVDMGEVGQLLYNPFDPRHHRGRDEEFGDLLGEGLYHLLHEKLLLDVAEDPGYWRHVVAERQRMIAMIRVQMADPSGPNYHRARTAIATLDNARAQHHPDLAAELAEFVGLWRHGDLLAWRTWLGRRQSAATVAEAVGSLGLEARSVASAPR